ncbi:MAG: hypothetical protein MSG64_15670 [Pyrinomonadaceae bacterium MAG19_C2-C3]|nr:hypothetical protein [Pyrinomonadaceae bacterium MAG19_C2-C3]
MLIFDEDLSLFFDDLAVDVTVTPANGDDVFTAPGIFQSPTQDANIYDQSVEMDAPQVVMQERDARRIDRDDVVRVSGTDYEVIRTVDDGTGMATIYLRDA